MKELLTGEVFIEEKLDGTLFAMTGYEADITIFTENLRVQHSVFYDRLPIFSVILDVADDHVQYPTERDRWGPTPPLIRHYLKLTPSIFKQQLPLFLDSNSAFATDSRIEGIVAKNYQKQLFGKVVNMEFYKGIEEQGSYLKRRKILYNRLAFSRSNRF